MKDYSRIIRYLRVEPFEMESAGLARKMNAAADAIEELLYQRALDMAEIVSLRRQVEALTEGKA